MSSQDRAQITFRSEMHLNDFKNESGSQLEKGRNQDLLILAPYWMFPASINHYIQNVTLVYGLKVVRKKEYYVNVMFLKFMVVKIQYREKKSISGHPAYCAQITRS